MITIRDVAEEANVSISSVSRFFNSPESLSVEMREKISVVIDRLSYKPNPMASSMRTNKTKNIAILIPSIVNMYYVDLYSLINTEISKLTYGTSLYSIDYKEEELYKYLKPPYSLQYDGIIIANLDSNNVWDQIKKAYSEYPVVIISSDPNHVEVPNIYVDVHDAIYKSTSYLIHEKGVRNPAYIGAAKSTVTEQEKLRGYLEAILEAGIQIDVQKIYHGENQHFAVGMNGVKYLTTMNDMVDGIVCSTDDIAIGASKQLSILGYVVQKDVSLIGFNGISILNTYEPEIYTVEQPFSRIAHEAVKLLYEQIGHKKRTPERIQFKCKLSKSAK